ncbi:MAG: hypothetical protein PW791_12035 [Neorhizobium sp.]|jgi:hypothetical protein|nr:hypothetical protein [Neorhizobium sp.]
MGTPLSHATLLTVTTTLFAVLALDISVPALVLSLMALSRWIVTLDFGPGEWKGQAA